MDNTAVNNRSSSMDVTRHPSSNADTDAESNYEQLASKKSRCCNIYLFGMGAWASQARK